MINRDELKTIANRLQQIALDAGAEDVQVYIGSEENSQIKLEKNDYHLNRTDDVANVVLRIHRDQRRGDATTNDLSDNGLRDVTNRALTLASASLPDEKLALSVPAEMTNVETLDTSLQHFDTGNLSAWARDLFAPAFATDGFSIDGGELGWSHSNQVIVNSNGVAVDKEEAMLSAFLMGMIINGGEVTGMDYELCYSTRQNGFYENTQTNFGRLPDRLRKMLAPKHIESYKGAVLLLPDVIQSLLLNVISFHANGMSVYNNVSKWGDKVGKVVASPSFNLQNDPHNTTYIGATGFDGAGTVTNPETIIASGVLSTHLESVDSAARRGTKANGYEGGIPVIRISGGDGGDVEKLARSAGKPILAVRRFSGNVDTITGDFSGVAKNSMAMVNGEWIPVGETMIAGNSLEMLQNIIAIGTSQNWYNFMELPPILVDGVSVTSS